jgi:L-threonylcarbamoyladenylate synthase
MTDRLNEAIKILKEGGIILYPTDTIWGLGCDATNPDAVEKIFQLKKRSDSKSLITLASDLDMICRYVKEIPEMAPQLVEISTTPLTIIYPEGINLAINLLAEDRSVAIRIPMNDFCITLIKKFRKPIVSTSANISGQPFPKRYQDISKEIIDSVDWIADPIYEEGATKSPSSIIKLGIDNQIKVIR